MKKTLIFLSILLFYITSFSQNTSDNESYTGGKYSPEYGPDKKHFFHSFISYGFYVSKSEGEGVDILYGYSNSFTFGLRYKYEFSGHLAVGIETGYEYTTFKLKQEKSKLVPDTAIHDKEKFKLNNWNFGLFFRIKYREKRNTAGNFIDIGMFGNWLFDVKHQYSENVDLSNQPAGYKKLKIKHDDLNYFSKFHYGTMLKIGFSNFVIYGKYRLSDLFTKSLKTEIADVELPRLELGIQIGFHR